jgi:hypothetical protein
MMPKNPPIVTFNCFCSIKNYVLLIILLTGLSSISSAQTISVLKVSLPKPTNGIAVLASVNPDEISFLADSSLALVQNDSSFSIHSNQKNLLPRVVKDEVIAIPPKSGQAQERYNEKQKLVSIIPYHKIVS